jgi:hypothetical protein
MRHLFLALVVLMGFEAVGQTVIVNRNPEIEAMVNEVKAENLEQATSIAQTCPLLIKDRIVIEVRPIMNINES